MKFKKIGAVLALSGFLALSCNSIFAGTLSIENIGENKYVGYCGMNLNHSNYAYYLSDVGQVYCDYPGEAVRNGYEYNMSGVEINPSYYYAMTLDGDTQLKQAALWRFSGGDVQPRYGSLSELYSYCDYVQNMVNDYNNQTTTIDSIIRTLHYSSSAKAYVSQKFNVGKGFKINLYGDSTSGAYFEKDGQNVGRYISDSAGDYRIVLPVDTIDQIYSNVNVGVTAKDDLGAVICVSNQTSQRMILPYRGPGAYFNIQFDPIRISRGDINKDGNTNMTDCNIILNIIKEKTELDTFSKYLADINNDGSVNYTDYLKLLSQVKGLDKYVKGDMNKDNFVNSTDASFVLDRFKSNDATAEDYILGNMNEDDVLNSIDASMILDVFKNS